ncbi:hypothetical protein VNO77_18702 [Canavalia gladiata]|uniref:Uncharacterized protein n=1 Tax=Canavalia gladiata TaxID=3824 RepID=A0AAN9QNX8_CANGL
MRFPPASCSVSPRIAETPEREIGHPLNVESYDVEGGASLGSNQDFSPMADSALLLGERIDEDRNSFRESPVYVLINEMESNPGTTSPLPIRVDFPSLESAVLDPHMHDRMESKPVRPHVHAILELGSVRHAKGRRNFIRILSLMYRLLLVVMASLKGPTRGIGVIALWRPRGSCLQRSHAHGEAYVS